MAYANLYIDKELTSIIIVHHNRPDYLKNCIASLRNNTSLKLELIIFDVGSTLDTRKRVFDDLQELRGFENIILIQSPFDLNVSRCFNMGVMSARGGHVIVANEDMQVKSKCWLERFINHANNHPEAYVIGVTANRSYYKQHVPADYDTEKYIGETFEIDQVSFILAYIRRQSFSEIGLFDENLGWYSGCDGDYAVRVSAKGKKLIIAKDIYVEHYEYGDRLKYEKMFPEMMKKYGVKEFSPANIEKCIEKAKIIYDN